jgi:hypothetical protein
MKYILIAIKIFILIALSWNFSVRSLLPVQYSSALLSDSPDLNN